MYCYNCGGPGHFARDCYEYSDSEPEYDNRYAGHRNSSGGRGGQSGSGGSGGTKRETPSTSTATPPPPPPAPTMDEIIEGRSSKKLKMDFGKMLNDSETHDVTIRCGVLDFTAHKIILAGRSSVFKAMFMADMKESINSLVEIPEINPIAIKCMLSWIYTGSIFYEDPNEVGPAFGKSKPDLGDTFNLVLDILKLAHQYDLPILLDFCQLYLAARLDKNGDKIIDTLIIADLMGMPTKILKDAAFKFILKNKAIVQTQEFQNKVSKELLSEVFMSTPSPDENQGAKKAKV